MPQPAVQHQYYAFGDATRLWRVETLQAHAVIDLQNHLAGCGQEAGCIGFAQAGGNGLKVGVAGQGMGIKDEFEIISNVLICTHH